MNLRGASFHLAVLVVRSVAEVAGQPSSFAGQIDNGEQTTPTPSDQGWRPADTKPAGFSFLR